MAQRTIDEAAAKQKEINRAAEETLKASTKAEQNLQALQAEIAKMEAVHKVNAQAAAEVSTVRAGGVANAAGLPNNALSRNIVGDIGAMEGLAQGQKMDAKQTEMINHLVAGLRAQGVNQATINGLLLEMKNLHVDQAQKLQDIWAALKQLRAKTPNLNGLPGN